MFPPPRADGSSVENLGLTCIAWGLWPSNKRSKPEWQGFPTPNWSLCRELLHPSSLDPEDSCSGPQKFLLRASPHSPGLSAKSYIHLAFLPRAAQGWQASASGALSSCSALSSFPKLPCTYSLHKGLSYVGPLLVQ